ncbi:uncharacterized protein [Eucyclogobius newberryi]|uniref:uncharacterized protein n=1 Tax=Eucyclogobius newberryi TaxID=166745 RepID=UPI003B5985B0
MEISVELDKLTGKTQVISSASITPDIIQAKGLKVYEDGRRSVYALPPGGAAGEVSEMSSTDVEELLRQATEWSGDVQYHQPVFATPFTSTSRPSTPRTSSKTTSPSLVHSKRIGNPNLASSRSESRLEVCAQTREDNNEANNHLMSSANMQAIDNINESPYAILSSIKTSSNAATSPIQPAPKNMESHPLDSTHKYELDRFAKSMNIDKTSAFWIESTTDNFGQSETPSPTASRSKLGMEEYQEESDWIPMKSTPKNTAQTLPRVSHFSDLVSEEICDHKTSSLMVTHRYEMDLIKRSMNKDGASPTNSTDQNEMQVGRFGIELEKDMTPDLASASAISEGLPTTTKPVHKNLEISPFQSRHELNVTKRYRNLHETLPIQNNDFSQRKTPSPALSDRKVDSNLIPTKDNMTRQKIDNQKAALVSILASSDGMPTQLIYRNIETSPEPPQRYDPDTTGSNLDRNSPTYTESLANSLLEELDPEAVTLIFMGYNNVDEEENPIEVELVVVGNSDEEYLNEDDGLSIYHPNGYTSKVFQPVVGFGKVTGGRDLSEELQ